MKFHIVSDSSCDLGMERIRQMEVTMVSFYVAFEDTPYYREERDISAQAFYQMMADRTGEFPKTSMPTVEDYLEAFRPSAREGVPILCICLNAQYSGSIQAAQNAAEELLEEYPQAKVHVMDSQLATVLQGQLVEEAVLLRDRELSLEEAVAALEPLRAGGRIFFTTSNLDYLYHGGRIGKAAAATGALLRVKPLIGFKDRELISDGIAQGRKKSLARVQELFFRHVQREQLNLNCWRVLTAGGLDQEEYAAFTAQLKENLAQKGYHVPDWAPYHVGVAIGVHTGPTPIGISILPRAIPLTP